ncbi:hypothetical protein [Streptomyces nitrosporeus]|uniref:hypothetical protein n=1 Tax=Streptomyces nitrosporeus TaxID=28894 RepID=UPI0039A019DD
MGLIVMKHKRVTLTALAAATVLVTAGAAWYTTLDASHQDSSPAAVHGLCLPATETDEDKAGYAQTIALVAVERTLEYREESADAGGTLMSEVTVLDALKGDPPKTMTVGQSALPVAGGGYVRTKPAYLPLEPGHRYVIGAVPDGAYEDGWVWFATTADTGLPAVTARWKRAIAHQAAPHPDSACEDTPVTSGTPTGP